MPEITIEVDDATFARLARVAERAGQVPQLIQRDLETQTPRLSMKSGSNALGTWDSLEHFARGHSGHNQTSSAVRGPEKNAATFS